MLKFITKYAALTVAATVFVAALFPPRDALAGTAATCLGFLWATVVMYVLEGRRV